MPEVLALRKVILDVRRSLQVANRSSGYLAAQTAQLTYAMDAVNAAVQAAANSPTAVEARNQAANYQALTEALKAAEALAKGLGG